MLLPYTFVSLSRVRRKQGFQPGLDSQQILLEIEPAHVGLIGGIVSASICSGVKGNVLRRRRLGTLLSINRLMKDNGNVP